MWLCQQSVAPSDGGIWPHNCRRGGLQIGNGWTHGRPSRISSANVGTNAGALSVEFGPEDRVFMPLA